MMAVTRLAWSRGGKGEVLKYGGASRDRTDDLIVANDALSQLSYSPTWGWIDFIIRNARGARRLALDSDYSHQFFHCFGTFVQCGLFFCCELDLDNLLDAF